MVSLDAKMNYYDKAVLDNIRDAGWHLQGVFPTKDQPKGERFIYSIGMARHGMGVELLCIGNFPQEVIGAAMNTIGVKFGMHGVVKEGEFDLGWTVPVKLRLCGPRAKEDYTCQVERFWKEPYDVVQVLLQDKNGVYQDDPACSYGLVDLP